MQHHTTSSLCHITSWKVSKGRALKIELEGKQRSGTEDKASSCYKFEIIRNTPLFPGENPICVCVRFLITEYLLLQEKHKM